MPIREVGRIIRFGAFEIDLHTGELRRNGLKVRLQEQPFQVLALMLERPGEVVTREDLRTRLWPADTFVDFDHSLNAAIKRLRDALGESAESPIFIETVARRGYRFITPAIPTAPVMPTAPAAPKPNRYYWPVALVSAGVVLVLLSLALITSNGLHPEPRLASQRRLTANPEDTPLTSGVISPDGKYLAYTDPSGFYLRQVDGGETHAVPLPKGFDALPESWFPDSVHLVVSWAEEPKKTPPSLWEISVLGGTPRKLVDRGSSARVAPDGSKIAFLAGVWDHEEIWLVQADGNSPRKIDGGTDLFGAVAWAPDAKRFAYIRTIDSHGSGRRDKQIESYDVTSGRRETMLSEPRLGDEIAWLNAGRLIYSLQEFQPNESDFNLWWVQLDSRTRRPSNSPARITNDGTFTGGISSTIDGTRIALLRRAFKDEVYLTEWQGQRLSAPRKLTLDERKNFVFSWTPDGKAVLFTSDRYGPFHVFKQSIDETQPVLLVGGKDDLEVPRLSPDGSGVLYLVSAKRGEPSSNVQLMRIPLSGGTSQFVLEAPGITNYECARLPATLCIYGRIGPESEYYRFFTFDPVGGNGTELVAAKMKKEEGLNQWALSPDGKYLVTCKSQNPYKQSGLRILNLAEGTERYIPVSGLGLVGGMDWAADSKSVWLSGFLRRNAWGSSSAVLNVDLSGRARMVLEGPMSIWWAVPSPDGHRIALSGHTESSNVWLLENF